jgi:hypothetical protein
LFADVTSSAERAGGGMRDWLFIFALLSLLLGVPLRVLAQEGATPSDPVSPICATIESTARTNSLPLDFFIRLIWQESRFRPDSVGPATRSGARAQGIAQFMPATAAERRLLEPFNPAEALPKSGELLAELRDAFGNLGLAAAAYNVGPQRVREFIAGTRPLPAETRSYVRQITGRSVEDWTRPKQEDAREAHKEDQASLQAPRNCQDIMQALTQTTPTSADLETRNVPTWCRHLRHPNANVCGSVHETEPLAGILTPANIRGDSPAGGGSWLSAFKSRHRPSGVR